MDLLRPRATPVGEGFTCEVRTVLIGCWGGVYTTPLPLGKAIRSQKNRKGTTASSSPGSRR